MLMKINAAVLALATLAFLCVSAQNAYAGEKKKKHYDRPYGRSLDNEYQEDYHSRKKVDHQSLFTQDLYEEHDMVYRERPDFDENQSYMVPQNKKTIPTWRSR